MHALRLLEETAIKNPRMSLVLSVTPEVAEYLSNHKRMHLLELEKNYQVGIQVVADESLLKVDDFKMERIRDDGVRTAVAQESAPLPHGQKIDLAALGDEIVIGDDVKGRRGRRHRDWRRKRGSKDKNAENNVQNDEENFKIVEQSALSDMDQEVAPADKKVDRAQQKAGKNADQPRAEQSDDKKDKPTKKGWWNRLVN